MSKDISKHNVNEKPAEKHIEHSKSNEVATTTYAQFPGHNDSSSSSVKLRKSSNIFSAFMRKTRRRKTGNKNTSNELKNLHVSTQNFTGSSAVSLATHIEEEIEIGCQSYGKKCSENQEMLWQGRNICSETNTSNHSATSSNKTGKTSSNREFKDDTAQTSSHKSHLQYLPRRNTDVAAEYLNDSVEEEPILSSFMSTRFKDNGWNTIQAKGKGVMSDDNFGHKEIRGSNFENPKLDVTHADALQYLQEVINGFHESESHIISLLEKYITDPSVQKEMKNAISNHTKLQWEAERRSCALANDVWTQQLEIGRAQEKILQGTLQSLLKQNRQLQIENESLYRKYEKANKMLRGYPDHSRSRYQECDSQIDSVLRHNEKLQTKLETLFKKIDSLESELQIFQKQNDTMEEQLRGSSAKLQNLKSILHKMKTDYEIEQVSLNFKLETKENILKEALEMGDIILEDLDGLKIQLQKLPFNLNWSKFQVKGDCLTDLLHMCRSCINEVSKELINVHAEITLKDKDIIALRETHVSLQESLKKSLSDIDTMSQKIEENAALASERHLLEQKCQMLEKELHTSEHKIESIKAKHEEEKSNLLQNIVGYDKYIKELEEKEKLIQQTKLFVANITTENYSLQNEIVALNRLIKETGAGDIVREIEYKQEELQFFKNDIEKLRNENSRLKIQVETAQSENAALVANEEITYKTLQRHVKELERLNDESQGLKQKIELEHQTVLSLQNERMKYLEEKSLLKSIIQHLKSEMSKIKQLEEKLTKATKDASKLGLMAEYSKQKEELLRQEVSDRDSSIADLKASLQKFNEVQMENAKEQVSLRYELSEVSQLKEKLSKILNTEVKKNAELDQSKDAMIQKIEEKQRNERTAIRILLKDIKIAAEEKENALKEKYKFQMEVEQSRFKLSDMEEKLDNVSKELITKSEENTELRKLVYRYEKTDQAFNEKWENEASKYESELRQLKKLVDQLENNKQNLESSNEYLKNNTEKLYKDLSESRQSEKATFDILNKIKHEQEEAKKSLRELTQTVKDLTKEKDKLIEEKYQLISEKNGLTKESQHLNTLMDKVVNDFEKSIKTAEEKEKMFKDELDETRKILYSYENEIRNIKQAVLHRERIIEGLRDAGDADELHEKRYNKLKEEMIRLEIECRNLKQAKTDLEDQLSDLKDNHNKLTNHIANLEKESEILESQMKIVLDQKEEDYLFYKKHIAEISRTREELEVQNEKELNKLRLQLQDVTNKLVNEKTAYETLSQIHKDISGKFMKGIKDLVDEKNLKQHVLEKFKEDKINLENLKHEKKELNKQIKVLTDQLEKLTGKIRQMTEENIILQKNYTLATEKCTSLEDQIRKMETEHHRDSGELGQSQADTDVMKKDLEESLSTIHRLKMEILDLQKQITLLQLERSELALQLHDTEKKLETEQNLVEQLKNTQKLLLAAVMQLKDDGKVDSSDCIHLLHMVRSSSRFPLDDAEKEH